MSISSVSSSTSHSTNNVRQSAPPPARAEKTHNQDRNNSAASGINGSAPTINTSGQRIGGIISVSA